MEEKGVKVDHSLLNRWVINYSASLALAAKNVNVLLRFRGGWMKPISKSRVNGLTYIETLINSAILMILCFLSTVMRQRPPAFFKQAIDADGFPQKIVMDKSGANYAGLENINILLMLAGLISFVEILQVKYLNNLIEQDSRIIVSSRKS